jgi:hypothetical protein
MEYTMRPDSKNKFIAYLLSAGAILMFVGILMTTIAYDKMVLEYAAEKHEFKLDKSFRDLIEEIKDISISTITLTLISSVAIFYKWEELRLVFNAVIDPLVNTHLLGAWILRVILCIVVISLGMSILGSENYDTPNNWWIMYVRAIFGVISPIIMIFILLMKGSLKYLWMLILGIVILGCTAGIHGVRAKTPEYEYNRYEKPLYGVTYVLASLSILDAGSIYTPNALTALFKIGMPLATVGLSSYLVYLGDKFFQLSRQVQIR